MGYRRVQVGRRGSPVGAFSKSTRKRNGADARGHDRARFSEFLGAARLSGLRSQRGGAFSEAGPSDLPPVVLIDCLRHAAHLLDVQSVVERLAWSEELLCGLSAMQTGCP
jgi:hypothetical protein